MPTGPLAAAKFSDSHARDCGVVEDDRVGQADDERAEISLSSAVPIATKVQTQAMSRAHTLMSAPRKYRGDRFSDARLLGHTKHPHGEIASRPHVG